MYDPTVGRFLTEDPLGFLGGDTNLSRYVGNDPTNFADPTGMAEQPVGTADNGYAGLGKWTFQNEAQAIAFFTALLDPAGNKLPSNWIDVVKDGCIGLNLVRLGWAGLPTQPKNGLFLRDAVFYTNLETAKAKQDELNKANPDKKYCLYAAQLPTRGNGASIAKKLGDGPLTTKNNFNLDMTKFGDFNFATWFSTDGGGYWEFMNHNWKEFSAPFPAVIHNENLPNLGDSFLTLYGVVVQRTWTAQ
jgi:hypothetical protein